MVIAIMKSCSASSCRLIVLGVLFLIPSILVCATGQQPQSKVPVQNQPQSAPLTTFTSGTSALHIPFELSSNVIFLEVRVNGSGPLWFVLDTGAAGTLLDTNRAKTLGIKVSGGGNFDGAGEKSVAAGMTKNVSFSLPGVDFQAREVVVLP